jgi:hypothetical protein|tara:strand:+ start:697 stop:1182 length:486 start_codon:yes stop_codon:yes gene_type:complete
MSGRFFSANDLRTFETFNKELIGDLRTNKDGLINQKIKLFKVSAEHTTTNLYGESTGGKIYKPGVQFACMIESSDVDFTLDEFGADSLQDSTFFMLRETLTDLELVPELGDIVEWNYAHFEINGINENQLVGGMYDQNWSVNCTAHLIRSVTLQIERVRKI